MKGQVVVLCLLVLFILGFSSGQEASYGAHVPPGVLGSQGWSAGGNSGQGSYYHYHVPLVGQQQPAGHYPSSHYPAPAPSSHSKLHEILLWVLPLLLVGIGPALFLPFLLKLFLLPLGLSLLGLLIPLLMMGMMMMMMMMGGGMMMMPMRNQPTAVTTARVLSQLFDFQNGDNWSSGALGFIGRSIDMDKCPERLACEIGLTYFKNYTTTEESGRDEEGGENSVLSSVLKFVPKGQVRTLARTAVEALRFGSKHGNCVPYNCQPRLRFAPAGKSNAEVKTAKVARKDKNGAAEDGTVIMKQSASSEVSKSSGSSNNNAGTKQNNSKTVELIAEP